MDLGRLSGIWERTKRKRKQHTEFAGCAKRCMALSQSSRTIAESISKEQLTRNVSTTLSVNKYQRNNFHYFQTTGTTGTLLEILSEHTPEHTPARLAIFTRSYSRGYYVYV